MLKTLFVATLAVLPVPAAAQLSSYAGQETREIKALAPEDIDGLLQAKGMGLAKAAELNGYPGPPHVLEHAEALQLSPEQVAAMKDAQARMAAAAKPLGAAIIDRERDLDRLFAEKRIDRASLEAATAGLAKLQGELRAVHLAAHLETRATLKEKQIAAYDRLRGYTGQQPHGEDERHH